MNALRLVQASTLAPEVDALALSMLAASMLVLFVVFGLIFFFGIRYRKGSPHSREGGSKNQSFLELGWSLATLAVFFGIFGWGAVLYMKMHVVPAGAAEITVVGKQWMWKFQHAEGQRELNELHVPVGKPILLTMTSQDVIHSFFVPAFRLKQDVLPGRYTQTWFQATTPGEYHLFCAQYCGTAHSEMRGKIIVLSAPDYQRWLETGLSSRSTGGENKVTRGARLFNQLGCLSCHSANNSGVDAPRLDNLFGSLVALSDGTHVRADENYIRESIVNPNAKVVQGFASDMPTFSSLTNEEDVLDLIAYIKSLHNEAPHD
jgi:cytochrome c oxidase subunit 2